MDDDRRLSPPAPAAEGAKRPPGGGWWWLLIVATFAVLLIVVATSGEEAAETNELTFSTFLERVDDGEVASATVVADGLVTGTLADGGPYRTRVPVELVGEEFVDRLVAAEVEVEASAPVGDRWAVITGFAPVLLLIAFFVWMLRRSPSAGPGAFSSVAKAKAKVINEQRPDVRFGDVAGYEGVKEELQEVVDFLRDPAKFRRVGAKGPKGVLMLGPPGTGKTLVARALAGEAAVPFLTATGSAFVEMFVGVGAARVRDLFEQAHRLAPAIIFIDEIDAVGQRRGANPHGSNDEREQTLNQLLAEMDGFDPAEGVVVMAATNRPDVLDRALLRPGRFDRHITVPLPNRDERDAILGVHCRTKPLSPEVGLAEVARATPGFSGADLANLANEAAIAAMRAGRDRLERRDFDDARDRILLGRRERSTMLLPEERQAVAFHEAGHALVAALSPHTDPLTRVTILPSGPALGATEQLPVDDRHLYPETYLHSLLAVRLGGRAGEIVALGEASSGAADDLAKATQLATRMVRELGLSGELGPVGYPAGSSFLDTDYAGPHEFSDDTQRAIDLEVRRLLRAAEEQAIKLLQEHRPHLDHLAELLLRDETVSGEVVYQLVQPGTGSATGAAA